MVVVAHQRFAAGISYDEVHRQCAVGRVGAEVAVGYEELEVFPYRAFIDDGVLFAVGQVGAGGVAHLCEIIRLVEPNLEVSHLVLHLVDFAVCMHFEALLSILSDIFFQPYAVDGSRGTLRVGILLDVDAYFLSAGFYFHVVRALGVERVGLANQSESRGGLVRNAAPRRHTPSFVIRSVGADLVGGISAACLVSYALRAVGFAVHHQVVVCRIVASRGKREGVECARHIEGVAVVRTFVPDVDFKLQGSAVRSRLV